ncbi:MAG TPA: MarR family transcriptional regulator [Gordonia sp. (in: high G+C Gram-positive bacteria)]|uniref:MarR family winged helix-turn-helix transcriptional regulator n=1 Tax=unclassified Gordonia (in: high G+C Gram-positive bacteria) TaxID=2657482 RepID=UPI0025C4A1F8|nr:MULTISPECIES: MarR family transcriptional regulator [unclassified Gordonia (in: high G+C Gram-positive bacteria)]HNP56102.1 MarR family transcriptional regulator [Gordonia sp. (in: high G+C Gram-positive bacteria)]HRC49776.1 MarR family transcriptional regulator [Gordonia sp. (in: high G+C Gram-positive bacteria)]
METSRVPSEDRQAIGQLLVRLLHEFRVELAAPRADLGYGDIREAHMQIFGNIATGDIRLTDLAARAQLSLAATSELVNELVSLGYLDRRPDPTDGRAKLIVLTERGQQLMRDAGQRVAHIEQQWAGIVGAQRFEEACAIMQELLDALDPENARR